MFQNILLYFFKSILNSLNIICISQKEQTSQQPVQPHFRYAQTFILLGHFQIQATVKTKCSLVAESSDRVSPTYSGLQGIPAVPDAGSPDTISNIFSTRMSSPAGGNRKHFLPLYILNSPTGCSLEPVNILNTNVTANHSKYKPGFTR